MYHEDIINFPEPASGAPVRLWMAGISYCDGSYRIRRQNSDLYVFEYVVKGRGYLKAENLYCEPASGDVYMVHFGTDHEYGSSAEDPWEKLWFNVSGPLVRELVRVYGLDGCWHFPQCDLRNIFVDGLAEVRADRDAAQSGIGMIIHRIVAGLAEHVASARPPQHSPDGIKLKRFLDLNLRRPLTLAEISRAINKSPSQAVRIFKRDWQMTPYHYLLERRLELAALYLRNTARSLKEIAAELQFADEYYFSHLFRQKFGLPPGKFRKTS